LSNALQRRLNISREASEINWLSAGSLRSGQRAAAMMTLTQSAKLNGHNPYVYLKGVLTRLPTQKNNAIDELLPRNWISTHTGVDE
jgi:hypothetical protein